MEKGNEGSTRQHLKILRGSRCSHIVIALNKMDLVNWSQDVFNKRVLSIKTAIKELFK
jgi:translation elongation factor EF-1alpha